MESEARGSSWRGRSATVLAATAGLAVLVACGGGGGGGGGGAPAGDGGLDDPTVYSSLPAASLPGAVEAFAVTSHTLALGGRTLAYTARAGHLIASHVTSGAAQASVFSVTYLLDGADPATRPVTFFYNGGPGSASVWLHLGSFGPKRLATGVPSTSVARPFPLVDNAESLLDVTDLVYIDAVGSGRSQAIAPFTNRSFWGVDVDAELFRDAIVRWLQIHGRTASPKFLYGESYGGPRSAVLARRLQDAGVMLDGVVLQSPAMDYHANCGVTGIATTSCAPYLPSYAAVGAWHALTRPVPADLEAWVDAARAYQRTTYGPAVDAWLSSGTAAPALWPELEPWTGLAAVQWQARFNMDPQNFRTLLLPGQIVGRFDGRFAAPTGSALAADGDPSSTWIGASFAAAIDSHLRQTLRYRNASTYVMLSAAIQNWDFSHDGRALPDTVPDLDAALAQNPRLRVLAVGGMHDLATPYAITEDDLARLAPAGSPRVAVRRYPGGHMSFLDDATRVRQKADLVNFYRDALAGRPPARVPAGMGATARRRALAAGDVSRAAVSGAAPAEREPAFQAPWCEPCVPSRVRASAPPASPRQ